MTKARDLASAAPAPSTVSATELGYLDGVTSNIQTQIDSKTGGIATDTPPASPTEGQVWLDTDGTTADANFVLKSTLSSTGDIFYASSANNPARLGIGSTGNVLTVSGGVPAWSAPAGGGKVLQVVFGTTSTGVSVTSNTTFSDTGLTATITPSATSSKILIMTSQDLFKEAQTNSAINYRLLRGGTAIVDYPNAGVLFQDSAIRLGVLQSIVYLDSPNTTSATTYKAQFKNYLAGGLAVAQADSNRPSNIVLMEIGA